MDRTLVYSMEDSRPAVVVLQHALPQILHLIADHALGLLLQGASVEVALGDGRVGLFAGHFHYTFLLVDFHSRSHGRDGRKGEKIKRTEDRKV